MIKIKYFLFEIVNLLYKLAYPIYKAAYFLYKSLSEKDEIDFLKKSIQSGMKVVDIGANIGFYTKIMADLVGEQGKVYAFEPDGQNFAHLKNTTKEQKNVILVNKAVGEKSGKVKLYYSSKLNVDHQTYDIGEERSYRIIEVVSLDEFLKGEDVDLVKLDIQGFDYFAFEGMRKTISKSKKIILVGEFWPYGLLKAGVNPETYLKSIKKSGLRLNYLGPKYQGENQDQDKYFYTNFYALKTK